MGLLVRGTLSLERLKTMVNGLKASTFDSFNGQAPVNPNSASDAISCHWAASACAHCWCAPGEWGRKEIVQPMDKGIREFFSPSF